MSGYILLLVSQICRTGHFWSIRFQKGPKTPHNKISDDVASKVVEIADRHPELDAREILEVLNSSSGHKPSAVTAQRILRSKGMNRPKGRRSKKTAEKKRTRIHVQKRALTK
jgi:hypothetical protein